jgi:hypothetical protein
MQISATLSSRPAAWSGRDVSKATFDASLCHVDGSRMMVWFSNINVALKSATGEQLAGFTIAGADRKRWMEEDIVMMIIKRGEEVDED